LHTLPAATKGKSNENERIDEQNAPQLAQATETGSRLLPSTTAIPRLITVVEIIKREYAAINAKRSPHLGGLFQYNEMGSLEDQVENEKEGEESAGDRMKMIAEALGGSKK
jgi:hypothetical protein